MPAQSAENSAPTERGYALTDRHSWVKLRIHVYICRKCGAGRVNEQRPDGTWRTWWHRPTGESLVAQRTPPCERGQMTETFLKKYEAAIAAAES